MTEIDLQQGSEHADGVVDLLGMLSYATLSGFFRLSADAAEAASLPDKIALSEMAVAEYGHFRQLLGRLEQLNVDPDAAMRPFVPALDAFHARTRPADWLEGLVKAYVGDSISADFYRMIADLLDPRTQTLVNDVLADTGHADFVIVRVRKGDNRESLGGQAGPVGPAPGRRGVRPGPADRRRARGARSPAGRRRPGAARQDRPDVRPAHRREFPPDGRPRADQPWHPGPPGRPGFLTR